MHSRVCAIKSKKKTKLLFSKANCVREYYLLVLFRYGPKGLLPGLLDENSFCFLLLLFLSE